MNVKLLRGLTAFFGWLWIVGVGILLLQNGIKLANGSFGEAVYEASSTNVLVQPFEGGYWDLNYGQVRVAGAPLLAGFQMLLKIAFLLLLARIFFQLRDLVGRIGEGRMFEEENVASLRRIGVALGAICALSIAGAIIVQQWFLALIGPAEGKVLHPSLSWNLDGVNNIWMEYSPPFGAFILALLAFIAADAFKRGMEYRVDSEGVL
ncbi:DUF2975 domain-containing protein [Sphingomicrobium aestuariivivum]|uniref:DUF2975 domain-containing protein n=1 Tax=Sphingomicrobium aestuariivivum TaxID=1582356 RepID=UPI001FD6A9DF|nr:DUF2975 domain-containing protein [Sphingomicrobium aestuariivivum]MCJ8191477.1 DUF2975 domain-containing protein [Sphingomicrobium aestuariivivum]